MFASVAHRISLARTHTLCAEPDLIVTDLVLASTADYLYVFEINLVAFGTPCMLKYGIVRNIFSIVLG
jgi:hypothetical protein